MCSADIVIIKDVLMQNIMQMFFIENDYIAAGELSKEDFEDLVLGRKDVAEMHALKVTEITRVKLEVCKLQLIDLVVDGCDEGPGIGRA